MPDGYDLRSLLYERARRDERAECEQSLYAFIKAMWRTVEPAEPFVGGWVLEGWCEHLEAITDGRITRLLGNVPPGTTKSLTTDVFWPAWEWGPKNKPHLRYLCTAYASHLTERDNRRFRQVVSSDKYQSYWGDRFKLIGEAVGLITNDKTGWKLASSVGGVSTGERADRIIMDDPNRPPTDEDGGETSSVMRATGVWFREVMPDRLNNIKKSVIVVIQQRLAEIDVSGTILSLGLAPIADEWEPGDYVHYMVPMEYDPLRHCQTVLGWSDPRGLDDDGYFLDGLIERPDGKVELDPRSPLAERDGEIAWPERFDAGELARLKQLKGVFGWAGQYQQRPAPREGGIIKEEQWQLWGSEDLPPFGTCIASLDTAYKENESADYNALTVWAAFEHPETQRPKVILRHAWQVRCSLSELVKKVITTCFEHKVDTLVIEDKTRGGDVADEIYRMIGRREIKIVLINVNGSDKVSRLEAVEPLFANNVIYAPNTEWAQMVIEQVSVFPRGRRDDLCFVAGTRIATKRGAVPIEDVVCGDFVVTPMGWCRVAASSITGLREVYEARGLEGTKDHPVYTLDKGYCALHSINSHSMLSELTLCGLIRQILPKQWNSWVLFTAAWVGSDDITYLNREQMPVSAAPRDCMSQSGSIITEGRYRLGMRSITETMTRLTVILKTWSAYRKASIAATLRTTMSKDNWRIWTELDRLRLNGIGLEKVENGIASMPSQVFAKTGHQNHTRSLSRLAWSVSGVALDILHGALRRLGSVAQNVRAPLIHSSLARIRNSIRTMLRFMGCPQPIAVNGAGLSLPLKMAREPGDFVRMGALPHTFGTNTDCRVLPTHTLRPVYNLTVEGAGCYYANGILVHNCDTVSMGLGYLRKTGVAVRREEFDEAVRERRMYRKQPVALYDV